MTDLELTKTIIENITSAHGFSNFITTVTADDSFPVPMITGTLYGRRFWGHLNHGLTIGGIGRVAGDFPTAFLSSLVELRKVDRRGW